MAKKSREDISMTSNPTSEGLVERAESIISRQSGISVILSKSLFREYVARVAELERLLSEAADRIEALEGEDAQATISFLTADLARAQAALAARQAPQAIEAMTEALIKAVWRWGESCGVDDISSMEAVGDSYNEGKRSDASKAKAQLLGAVAEALTTSEALVTALSAQLEGAKEALRPFAEEFGEGIPRDDSMKLYGNLRLGHFRLAASTLYGLEGDQEVGASVARLPAHVADATATDTLHSAGKED